MLGVEYLDFVVRIVCLGSLDIIGSVVSGLVFFLFFGRVFLNVVLFDMVY